MKKSKKILVAIFGVVVGASCLALPAAAEKCPEGSSRSSYTKNIAECSMDVVETVKKDENDLPTRVKQIINWVIGVLGIAAVIVIIIGGVFYMTSNGDAAKVKKGKDTILYGVIGLIIAVLAFAIVNFAIGALGSGG